MALESHGRLQGITTRLRHISCVGVLASVEGTQRSPHQQQQSLASQPARHFFEVDRIVGCGKVILEKHVQH
jgi:hypothetical protein